jgi:hypothetical protein
VRFALFLYPPGSAQNRRFTRGYPCGRAYGAFDYRLAINCQNFKTVNARHGGLAACSSGYSNCGTAIKHFHLEID